MDRLRAMEVFVRVVETNSFLKAAQSLALPRSSVTMTIQKLEQHLGARLINRTTRQLNLTVDGDAYYERCRAILSDVDAAESGLREGHMHPSGRLRVDMPASIGRSIILPALPGFRDLFPDVELDISMSDRLVNLIQEGVDCVIRAGALPDSNLIARRVGSFRWAICGAPSYFDRHGEPQTIADLQQHISVGYSSARNGRPDRWTLIDNGAHVSIEMRTSLVIDETFALRDLGVAGFGLIRVADFTASGSIRRGELSEVLAAHSPEPVPISALYPSSRHLSPTVRAFVDWANATIGPAISGTSAPSQSPGPSVGSAKQVEKLKPR